MWPFTDYRNGATRSLLRRISTVRGLALGTGYYLMAERSNPQRLGCRCLKATYFSRGPVTRGLLGRSRNSRIFIDSEALAPKPQINLPVLGCLASPKNRPSCSRG